MARDRASPSGGVTDLARGNPFDLPRLLSTLLDEGVSFVVVGGVAGNAHGSTSLTDDLDICYERTQPNTRALERALHALGAALHDGDRPLAGDVTARSLQFGDFFIFETVAGGLDCLSRPDGTDGYDDLVRAAQTVEFRGLRVQIASLDDLIRMKRAAGRPTDRIELEILGALREEIDRGTL